MEDDVSFLKVVDNKMIEYPRITYHGLISHGNIVEKVPGHINTFIQSTGLVVDYIDPNYVYGLYNEEFGNWTGMIGHVGHWLISILTPSSFCFLRFMKTKLIWQ